MTFELQDAGMAALITGFFSVLSLYVSEKVKSRRSKGSPEEEQKEPHTSLKFHPFFARTELLKNHIGCAFTLENKGKEAVFKDILSNQMDAFQDVLFRLAIEIDENKVADSSQLHSKHFEALSEIMNRHQNYYKDNPAYTRQEQHALDIVMKKYKTWNQTKIDQITDSITMVCNSPFYSTDLIKGAVILDIYLGVLVDTINDAAKSLNALNGDLAGLKFRNILI